MNSLFRHIFIILVGLFLWSCTSEKSEYERIVSEWQGKQIVLPGVMTDFLTGDTIDLSDADFTILTYVDSVGCTGCKMKLALWKEYLNSLYSKINVDLNFVLIVNTSDSIALNRLLNMYAFNEYVYRDINDNLNYINKFPKESNCQTFLLDHNKQVIAIGSPVVSNDIGVLYKSIISGCVSLSSKEDLIISITNNSIDLGNLHKMQSAKKPVTILNEGSEDVRIREVVSSCDCIDIKIPTDFIPSFSKLIVDVYFLGDTVSGNFERSINIYYDGMDYPTIINVIGNIE